MATDTEIRQISRERLFAAFKDWDIVRLVETLLYAVRTSIPTDTTAVQAALDAHIADPTDAHQASAIGFTPVAPLTANNVQAAILQVQSNIPAVTGGTSYSRTFMLMGG